MLDWIHNIALVMRREFRMVLSSAGTMLFFFALPLAYPIVYSAIYTPEVTRDMPVAVVDRCRTAESREFVRHADATQAMKICGYAADMEEARRWWAEKKCFAVIEIPADYSEKVTRGEQGVIQFYSDASLLLRYRTFLESLTELQMATDADLREQAINTLGASAIASSAGSSVGTEAYFLGDTQQGFASFIIPGIVVFILQQSMLLGITFLGGGANERRRANRGVDPLAIPASPSATIIGKTLCYVILYLPLTVYILHYIPIWFHFPHQGNLLEYVLFIFPMLLASAMLGQTLTCITSEKESAFVVIVFTTLAFLFLSGLTWPRYAMPVFWQWVGDIVPATWGVEGFIRINNNGGTLAQQSTPYLWLWGLTAFYSITAYLVARLRNRTARK